jgi:hypothetical protein
MLGTMMVQLQRQPAALLHHNTLDQIALAKLERLGRVPSAS